VGYGFIFVAIYIYIYIRNFLLYRHLEFLISINKIFDILSKKNILIIFQNLMAIYFT